MPLPLLHMLFEGSKRRGRGLREFLHPWRSLDAQCVVVRLLKSKRELHQLACTDTSGPAFKRVSGVFYVFITPSSECIANGFDEALEV